MYVRMHPCVDARAVKPSCDRRRWVTCLQGDRESEPCVTVCDNVEVK